MCFLNECEQVLRSFFLKDLSETVWHTSIHILTTIRASWRRLYIRVEYDGKTSNLLSRQRNSNPKETFGYDKLDRLVSVNTSGNTTMNITYAPNGNILSKTGVGNYGYDEDDRPHAVMEVENRDGSIPLEDLKTHYNDFGKVDWISHERYRNTFTESIEYGPDEQRWYSETDNYPYINNRKIVYAGDYEKISDPYSSMSPREFYYLDGNTIVVRENGKYKYFLAFTDNIGSILSVIDENGVKVFDASYDAWGRQTVTRNDIGLLRGYTGHEMIPELEIINMNGRLYDPVLGRFFSPDNYVQMPENSQSFNRYSYCLNNPLKYNDPSGESFALVFAVFSVVSDMAIAAHNGENMLKAGAISALSAAATYGIGEWLGSTGKFSKELLRAGAHGLASGAISAISGNGRNFFSSFVSSAAASGIGSYASGVDINDGLMLASCTAVGGAVAWATGGDIILGAMNGLRIGMLNHEPHKIKAPKFFKRLRKHYDEGTGKDFILKSDEFKYLLNKGEVDFANAKDIGDGYYSATINFYNSDNDLKFSFGRATVIYKADSGKNIFCHFSDRYDFDSKPWGDRSYLNEIITRGYKKWSDGKAFNIYYKKIWRK